MKTNNLKLNNLQLRRRETPWFGLGYFSCVS